jgi:hypothetical protein
VDPGASAGRCDRSGHTSGFSAHEEARELGRGHGPAEQEALELVAAALAQEVGLLARLHALGHHAQVQARAIERIAVVSAASSGSSVMSPTNERSIFTRSIGKRRSDDSDE